MGAFFTVPLGSHLPPLGYRTVVVVSTPNRGSRVYQDGEISSYMAGPGDVQGCQGRGNQGENDNSKLHFECSRGQHVCDAVIAV